MKKPFIVRFTKLFFLLFVFVYHTNLQAQVEVQKQKSEFWQHVQFGGGIGLSFGSNYFSGSLSPSAIYRFDNNFAIGTALNLSYGKEKNYYENILVGASVLGLYNPIPQIQISAEFEQLHINRNFENPIYSDDDYWYPGLYLGVGFNTGPVTMGIRFDVLYDSEKSIYANAYNPFVRVYF